MHKTVVVAAVAMLAAGCSTADGTGEPRPVAPVSSGSSALLQDRPTYIAGISEDGLCPEGKEIESRSRQMAAELLPMLIDRVPTTDG